MATKKKRHKFTKKQKKKLILEIVILFLATVGAITILLGIGHKVVEVFSGRTAHKVVSQQPQLDVELLSINDYSRPGLAMNEVKGIVIHYTANPGSTAIQNRNYFEGLKDSHETMASSHFIVDATGKFNQQTYDSLVELTAYLMGRFQLTTDDVIRHYDVTGKKCPLYYVEHEDAWQQFLTDVNQYIDTHGEVQEE